MAVSGVTRRICPVTNANSLRASEAEGRYLLLRAWSAPLIRSVKTRLPRNSWQTSRSRRTGALGQRALPALVDVLCEHGPHQFAGDQDASCDAITAALG